MKDSGAAPESGATADSSDDDGDPNDPRVDAGPSAPQRVLVTFTGAMSSELVAVNVGTKAVDGRLAFPGYGATDARNVSSPFLLEQNVDVVARLGTSKPWLIDGAWNISMTDAIDGGSQYSQPVQVVVDTETKAYVLRQYRNDIAVIDESADGDGGAPSSSIDLSSYLQAGNGSGVVGMTAAAYVPAAQRLYMVLGNVNQVSAAANGGKVLCSSTMSTLIAIDAATNTVASLGGSGPKGSVELMYVNPVSAVYDSVGNRMLVVSAGCYASATSNIAIQQGIEAVDLTSFKSTSLLDLTKISFPVGFVDVPSGFAYIDATHAVIGFDQTGQAVYAWNPKDTTLGALIPNAPDVFTYDGNGHLLGTRVESTSTTQVVSVAIPGGASTTLATNVTSLTGASYVASVDVWPHP